MKTRGTKERLFATTLLAGMAAILGATPATAQDAPPPAAADEVEDDDGEAIIVTGSRIRRSEYSSSQPIQVIDANTARTFGAVDTAGLLQDSIAAGGPQIDGSFNSASGGSNAAERPPNSGPGSSSISLRGLDAERTLVLLNGRRLAPAGAGGAPTRPDINLLPSSILERAEILTGGASAIYGADAVAGVVNLITRSSFDGLEMQAFRSQPEQSGGEISQLNFITGAVGDRGNVMFAAEFYERNRIANADRDFASCNRRKLEVYDGTLVAAPGNLLGVRTICRSGFFDNAVFIPNTGGIVWYAGAGSGLTDAAAAGQGSTGAGLTPAPLDWTRNPHGTPNGVTAAGQVANRRMWLYDGTPSHLASTVATSMEFGRYQDQDERLDADLQAPLRRFAFYSQGDFDFGIDLGEGSPEFYYEMLYANRQTRTQGVPEQALPTIPAFIPRLVADGDDDDNDGDVLDRDDFERDGVGNLVFYDNPLSPFANDVEVIKILDDDYNQIRRTEVEQIRFTGGIRGDWGQFGPVGNFAYDLFGSYDRTIGFVSQRILFEPNVFFGTVGQFLAGDGVTPAGDSVTCGVDPWRNLDGVFTTNPDLTSPFINPAGSCVPLDFLNQAVLEGDNNFATDAEREFAWANRINRTVVEQAVFGAAFTGELWEMQGGAAAFAFGLEHRIDSINTTNDVVVEQGLQATEVVQSEGSARGETFQNDIYVEVELPLMADMPLIEELTLNAAARYTSEKSFGNQATYSLRGIWSPTDWLSFRGTYATAFRAPNLREQFLAQNASGTVGSSTDPCYVPAAAIDNSVLPSVYVPALETRTAGLLAACVASGADPTQLGLDGFSISVPTFASGNVALDPETAESYSAGFVLTNRWTDLFDADLAVTWWSTEVNDTVEELTGAGVIGGCFFSTAAPFTDPLCSRIQRAASGNPRTDFLSSVETSFINIGKIEVEGVDLNLRVAREFGEFLVSFNSANSYLMSLAIQTDAEDDATRVQRAGTRNNSRWEMRNTWTVAWDDFTVGLRSTYVEGTVNSRRREFRNAFFGSGAATAFRDCSWALFGNLTTTNICRDSDATEDYWKHDVSFNYANDAWSFTMGVNNVTDQNPPTVSATVSGGFQERQGVVTQGNYDLYGRTVFANVRRTF